MADRVGVINKGELILVEEKSALMRKLGKKQLTLELPAPIAAVPEGLNGYQVELADEGRQLIYSFDAQADRHRHSRVPEAHRRTRRRLQGPPHRAILARRHLRFPGACEMSDVKIPTHAGEASWFGSCP